MLGGFWHYGRKVSDEKPVVVVQAIHGHLPTSISLREVSSLSFQNRSKAGWGSVGQVFVFADT